MALLDEMCHWQNLARAFRRFERYRGIWRRGVTISALGRNRVEAMLELADELRSGRYSPEPPGCFDIAKADGSRRTLSVYRIRDRVAQRAFLQVVQPRTESWMADASHGFRPGRGVGTALVRAQRWIDDGYRWVVDTDIQRCFDSIPRAPLLRAVSEALDDSSAGAMVAWLLGWDRGAEGGGGGLPQGACLAPWLCNVYLTAFDRTMEECGIPSVRYADDLLLFAWTRVAAECALDAARAMLAGLRLSLHPVKTQLCHAADSVAFLGRRVGLWPRLGWQPDCPAGPGGAVAC